MLTQLLAMQSASEGIPVCCCDELAILQTILHTQQTAQPATLMCMAQGPNKMLEAAILAVHSNVKDLRKEFPLATFKTINALHANGKTEVPVTLVTCCPVGMREVVLKRMQQAADAIQFASATINTAGIEADNVRQVANSQQVAAFRAQLEEAFGCYISLAVDTVQKAMTITSLKVILPDVERRVRLWLGLPVQAASVLGLGPLKTEQKALQALLVSTLHTSACALTHVFAHDAVFADVLRLANCRDLRIVVS